MFKEVKKEVRLDTLDKLIEKMKRLTDLAYRTGAAIFSGRTKTYVTQRITEIDEAMAMTRQAYGLFRYQLDTRKMESGHSYKANQFFTELEHFIEPNNSNSFQGYLRMMELQREKAMEYIIPVFSNCRPHKLGGSSAR